MNVDNLRLSKDMKYEALYWALGYEELNKDIFTKTYNKSFKVAIYSDKQYVDFNNKISIVNGDKLLLTSHKSFVILECVDKLLTMGYKPSEIIIDLDNEYDIYCKDLYIKCYEWNHAIKDDVVFKKDTFKSISYESRLISGVIERKTSIKTSIGLTFNYGIFENEEKQDYYNLYNSADVKSDDFIIEANVAIKYNGSNKIVIVPEGITELSSCLFWDNQIIEEVVLPNSLVNISGDTFYNCSNLKKINIPKNVKFMGNNPFAGCPNIKVTNESPYFNLIDGVLYNKDFSRLIYYPINKADEKYELDNRGKSIGKHSFYLCDNYRMYHH